jgi:lysophospholipase L1-like esterase
MIFMAFADTVGAQASEKTILALGDSITAGSRAFRSPAEVPPVGRGNPESQYAYWLHARYPAWTISNRGISAQTSADIAARLDRELNLTNPQIVILMAGVNDIYRGYPQETLRSNLQTMYERIQARGIPLMVLTILPYRGLTVQKFDQLNEINRWIESYALQHQLGFCDTYHVLSSKSNPLSLSTTQDGLHPDPQGYRLMGEAIAAALSEWGAFQKLSEL